MVQLQNGCICCTLRTDLVREIERLYNIGSFDAIVIESTGISEPMHVAESFDLDVETLKLPSESGEVDSKPLKLIARLDTCVTVVDASTFHESINSIKSLNQFSGKDEGEEGEKKIGQLLLDQIEFANVVILNKIDLCTEKQLNEYEVIIRRFNRKANIVRATYSNVSFNSIIETGLYKSEEASQYAGWLHDLKAGVVHSESDEYGITSFVYKARRPFHPERLNNWLNRYFYFENDILSIQSVEDIQKVCDEKRALMEKEIGWIARSKGFAWVASRHNRIAEWSHGGRLLDILPSNPWYCLTPMKSWDVAPEQELIIRNDFQGIYGDRRQEIVFIGIGMKKDVITETLNLCLLSEKEFAMKVEDWKIFPDTLPVWQSSAGFWSCILVEGQETVIELPSDCSLDINNACLVTTDMKKIVYVILQTKNECVTICNLNAQYVQNATLNVHGVYSEDNTIRLKCINALGEASNNDNNKASVHLVGFIVQEEEEEEDEEGEEEGHHHHHH